ncbi:hypothetical protein RvY_12819 [Ramazzottius varieornatus]|uniref:Major facilitator superfamily (MFS) profile domain-containing protein n=1 Tax=Ramazzottius varieornatus TaxID=947166 RepID=A0A1D1VN26_RAMVA|nr:hypothetical protein RvY_12819 [Ramazzottius varieornatus]
MATVTHRGAGDSLQDRDPGGKQGSEAADSSGSRAKGTIQPQTKRIYGIVFAILLVDLLAFTCILPLLPALFDYYGQKDTKDSTYRALQDFVERTQTFLGIPVSEKFNSVLYGGLLGSLFSFLQFVASPLIGSLSDVYGRKTLLLITTAGIALSYIVWALSTSFTLFVLARIIGGISKGNISIGTAIITDVSTPETRGKGMALVGIAFSLGFIIGPMIGALFSAYAKANNVSNFFIYPAVFSLVLELLDLALIWRFLPETLSKEKRAPSVLKNLKETVDFIDPRRLLNFSAVKKLSAENRALLRKMGVTYLLFLFFFSGLEFTLTFLMHNRFDYNSVQQGRMFLFIGIIMIAVQGGYVRRIPAGKEKKVAILGLLMVIPAFVIIAFATAQPIVYLGLAMYSFSSATIVPCLTTIVSNQGGDDQKGTVMGIFRSLGALARTVGPLFFSTLYWSLGPTISYTIGGLLLSLPLITLRR